jgi:hypothetical protein
MSQEQKTPKTVTMERSEFDKLCRFKKTKDRELLFGQIDKELRKHGIDPKRGYQMEFRGKEVVVTQLGG